MPKLLFLLFLLFAATGTYAQGIKPASDSTSAAVALPDTSKPSLAKNTKNSLRTTILDAKFWQNRPRTAAILSLALPGAGQVYNKRWWKVPIVYGVLGGMAYLYKSNIDEYQKYRLEYIARDQGTAPNPTLIGLNKEAVQLYRDQYLSNAELAGLGLILTYLLNGAEAFVDAHLRDFDMKDDLSVHLKPQMQLSPQTGASLGVGVVFTIK